MARIVPSQVVGYLEARYPRSLEYTRTGMSQSMDHNHAAELAHLLWLLDHIPESLVPLSGKAAAEFGEAKSAIWLAVESWRAGNKAYVMNCVYSHDGVSPLAILHKHLSSLPDEAPILSPSSLAFLKDPDLERALRTDLAAVHSALLNGEWKAATVLAGSILEAFLLNAMAEHEKASPGSTHAAASHLVSLRRLSASPPGDLNVWTLHQLIEVAEEVGVIDKATAGACRIAKDFRNLIHPGRTVRLAQKCNRGTALSAVAAVEHCVSDLTS